MIDAKIAPSRGPRWRFTPSVVNWITLGVVTFLVAAGVATSGISGLLITVGLVGTVTALYSAITGRGSWVTIPSRKIAGIALAISLVLTMAGGAVARPALQDTASLAPSASATEAVEKSVSPTPTLTPPPSPRLATPASSVPSPDESVAASGAVGQPTDGAVVSSAGVVLPNSARTPGAINASVTQANIANTICAAGWTKTVRPPSSFTTALKVKQLASGYSSNGDSRTEDYEEDHLISLELGGSANAEANLWPEPYAGAKGARVKDQVENKLKSLVCSGAIPLAAAQVAIASNWWNAFQTYVSHAAEAATAPPSATATATAAPAAQSKESSSPPAGATGQCVDKTYTFAKHHSGACSKHGGVSVFY